MILTNDVSINDNYFIYYATGEYNKEYQRVYKGGESFDNYLKSYDTNNGTLLLTGQHFPRRNQFTKESFGEREARHNYFIRFKLDPRGRSGKGFYFSDLDTESDGGAFMANYFNYKLVDQDSHHIPIGNNKCGVMLKNNLRQDIGSLSASFALPDLATDIGGVMPDAFCLIDEENNKYVSNMVNFEIKSDLANVTVVAAPTDRNKPAALGIYKLDDSDFDNGVIDVEMGTYYNKFLQKYNNPDYAFFMPTDDRLSY